VILCSKVIFSYNFTVYFLPSISEATQLEEKLASNVKRTIQVVSEKGVASWLATLPITEHRFALHTKVHSEMPFAYDMAGNLPIYHLTASVANTSQSSMH